MSFTLIDKTSDFDWVEAGNKVFELDGGIHAGKLCEVTIKKRNSDVNLDGVVDFVFLKLTGRRVNADGSTITVGSSEVKLALGTLSIATAQIAEGIQTPTQIVAEQIQSCIEKLINYESAIGAFSFLPSE